MLKKPKILVVGSFVMDLIATTARVPNAGETVIGMKFQTAPGGKGANQAVQCARLGADVTMVGKVGADSFGKTMLDMVSAAGVDVSHVMIDQEQASGIGHITLEVTPNGTQNRITVCPGANAAVTVEDVAWLQETISEFDLVMLQFELPMEVVEAVARWAHEAGVIVMINPAPSAPMSEKLLACADYLSPNEHEAAALSGRRIDVSDGICFEDVQIAARAFHACGVQNLIITMGENGAVLSSNGEILHVPCVPMSRVADPTAAGDSFVAAFCTGVAAGLSRETALYFATYTAAITVSRMGAMPSLPTMAEVKALMEERKFNGLNPTCLDEIKRM